MTISSSPFLPPFGAPFQNPFGDQASSEEFSPLDLNPVLLFDSTNSSDFTLDTGNEVDQWNDLSGGDNHATATGGNRPIFTASPNRVVFDGSNDFMLTVNIGAQTQPNTIMTVATYNDTGVNRAVHGGLTGGTGRILFFHDAAGQKVNSGATQPFGTATTLELISAVVYDGASSDGYINGGTDDITTNPGTTSPVGLTLGAIDGIATFNLDGNIKFVAFFNARLTTSQINQMGNYLHERFSTTPTWVDI